MNLIKYLEENQAQKQIDKLAEKFKDKKIVIYGAGEYFEIILKNYDLSKLNIVAIADLKFEEDKALNNTPYTAIVPSELREYDFDVILMALVNDLNVINIVDKKILKGTKNEGAEIRPLISPTFKYIFKLFLSAI